MHPGPMNRGIEIDSSVADGKEAIILDQVLNGVASRMAILYLLLAENQKIIEYLKEFEKTPKKLVLQGGTILDPLSGRSKRVML
ncbi:MAG: hypothetical protein CM1200mP10_13010 [Candidatus Neomarinimicrobiota bacterium]|nr:MAG: hypothetical protein CM1200mP10_13010 [Candidatus Neomarinimicrobiota bacterium]